MPLNFVFEKGTRKSTNDETGISEGRGGLMIPSVPGGVADMYSSTARTNQTRRFEFDRLWSNANCIRSFPCPISLVY
jgi:hypothetical protein